MAARCDQAPLNWVGSQGGKRREPAGSHSSMHVGSDRIALSGLRGRGRHGVYPRERSEGQTFVVDAVLELDTRAAAAGDDLARTVDYGSIAEKLVAAIEGEPVNLIETLAARLAVLALGGNLGVRLESLQSALDALGDAPGIQPISISPVYETAPFGGAPDDPEAMDLSGQPSYLNAVAVVGTDLTPHQLLIRTQAIEEAMHRVRCGRWAARTIDVDIVVYDDLELDAEDLTVPHSRSHERAFVLRPWL